jgi:hypothetical protein
MTTSNPTDKESVAALALAKWAHRLAAEVHGWNVSSWNTLSEEARQFWIKRAKESGYVDDVQTQNDEEDCGVCKGFRSHGHKVGCLAAHDPAQGDGMRDALVKARDHIAAVENWREGNGNRGTLPRGGNLLTELSAALASHPVPQPGMTDEDLSLIEDLANALDREVDNGIAMVSDWTGGELVRRARARIAAIKRAAAGAR